MGIIWKSAMPLLSTLAALVIIVHSAEEDNEYDYRVDLRPRIVDTGINSYEQPWRVMDSEPVNKNPTQTNTWNNNSTEDTQKHQRLRRKRKRRPQASLTDNLAPQKTMNYPEEPLRSNFEVELTNTETPKKRRKKPDSKLVPWTDVPLQRPFRRRGQRRKRPTLKIWPESNEFNSYPSEENLPTTTASNEKKEISYTNLNNDDSTRYISNIRNVNESELAEDFLTIVPENSRTEQSKDEFRLFIKEKGNHNMQHRGPYLQEDKSVSELSLEVNNADELKNNVKTDKLHGKLNDKSTAVYNEYVKAQVVDSPVDPITLKDILRRSNGTSLSEILQVHNLSLADLLNGKENAISILKSEGSYEAKQTESVNLDNKAPLNKVVTDNRKQLVENDSEENLLLHLETKYVSVPVTEFSTTTQSTHEVEKGKDNKGDEVKTSTVKEETKIISIRRHPLGARRKLHMSPTINSTHKSPLSRDLIALNTRKYLNQRRNLSKPIEWRNVIEPSTININNTKYDTRKRTEISTIRINIDEDQETQNDMNNHNQSVLFKDKNMELKTDAILSTTSGKPDSISEIFTLFNETRYNMSTTELVPVTPGLQKHNFSNRIKNKRRRQKNTTTELPPNKIVTNSSQIENIPSPTNIITRTQEPKVKQKDEDFVTILEDFMTTRASKSESYFEVTTNSVKRSFISSSTVNPPTTTHMFNEKTAKIEIDEIFKDIETSATLSKILMERNMTLRELAEHRERGSSHVHLADIFHNASKEPNPPEPFLSKSVIEPISKETYPLRAILEANAHDAAIKPMIDDPSILELSYLNIPVVMDFGNNVNENAENMGIMSLFNNFTKSVTNNKTFEHDVKAKAYETDLIVMNTTDNKIMPTVRQNRVLNDNTNQDDVVSWNEIFSLMRRNYKNETKDILESLQEESSLSESALRINAEHADGDNLFVLEDLHHLKSLGSNISPDSNDGLDMSFSETINNGNGNFEKIPTQTKSITVATASIAGLAMVLFLLTYAVFKWKRHKGVSKKDLSFCNERIPTPVFENRKRQKNNSSTRSISPMLSTSNIYTLKTLDSRNGKESPEYMWDTLRKPFQ